MKVNVKPMMKIEAVIHSLELDDVTAALENLDCENITASEVLLRSPSIPKMRYRGYEYVAGLRKVKLEILTSNPDLDDIIEALSSAAHTPADTDETTIIVYPLSDAVRIRGCRRAS